MERRNYFSDKYQKKSDWELKQIIDTSSDYDTRAVQAAIWILEERGKYLADVKNAESGIKQKENNKEDELIKLIGIPVETLPWTSRFLHGIVDTILVQSFSYIVALLPYVNFNMLFSFALFPVYYIFFETKFRQTPGKMITESIVTYSDGNAPSLKSVILRTAARYIPFEGLTVLGSPSWGWHDKWTKTYVIRKADLNKLNP